MQSLLDLLFSDFSFQTYTSEYVTCIHNYVHTMYTLLVVLKRGGGLIRSLARSAKGAEAHLKVSNS